MEYSHRLLYQLYEFKKRSLNYQILLNFLALAFPLLCLQTYDRAIINDPAILLLDNPGNSLDLKQDKILLDTIQKLKNHCTIIMTTHRPPHLLIADQSYMLKNERLHPTDKRNPK